MEFQVNGVLEFSCGSRQPVCRPRSLGRFPGAPASWRLATRALKLLLHLPGLRLVALDRRLGKANAQLAASAGLRGADAVYAALAQHLSIPLVTWDDEIGQSAGDLVTVMQPPREADR
jgi:hypothetical protein